MYNVLQTNTDTANLNNISIAAAFAILVLIIKSPSEYSHSVFSQSHYNLQKTDLYGMVLVAFRARYLETRVHFGKR